MYIIGKVYEEMDDKETLIKVTTILERLVIEVSQLNNKVDQLKDNDISKLRIMEKQLIDIEKEDYPAKVATHAEKINRLESIIYWGIGAIALETLTLITSIIIHFVSGGTH